MKTREPVEFRRGDILWIQCDPSLGVEPRKTRTCVVVSNDVANQASTRSIVYNLSTSEVYFRTEGSRTIRRGLANQPVAGPRRGDEESRRRRRGDFAHLMATPKK